MKKIEAIIRKTKFDEVKEALNDAGIEFFTFWEVRGIGKAHESRVYRGIAYDTSTIERMLISIYCREKFLKPAVDAIMNAAKTGEIGDGKIFVSEISDAFRIRTGEEGDKALYVEGGE
ncbi:MAG: P-II family nitrogen regulator [Bacteroidales bacterium]|nr:P-II family nitrogen regulator [Bacteroidales bacterium]MCB9013902.1 P-II family nitrogen regulator [Bacteroidales bacterium]